MSDEPQAIQHTSDSKTWGPLAATIWAVFIYLVPQALVGVLLSIYPTLKGWSSNHINDWLTSSIPAQFVFTLFVEAISVGIVLFLLRHYKTSPRKIGLKRPKIQDAFYTLIGFAVYFVGYLVLLSVLQKIIPSLNVNQQQDIGFQTATAGISLVMAFLSLVVLPPVAEEIIFRGFVFTGFRRTFGFIAATLATSLLFAIPHLLESSNGGLLWIAGIDTFILSVVLCFLREKTDRLWAGMGVHMLKNFVAFASLFIFHFR
jgi:CAAX protease family protein